MNDINTIIALGYTLLEDGSISPVLKSRLDLALTMYDLGKKIIVSGRRPPQFVNNTLRAQQTEAEAMCAYLLDKGVNREDILLESLSTTTFLNFYYSRILHLEPLGIKSVCVITNEFHAEFAKCCVEMVFGSVIAYQFNCATDEGISDEDKANWQSMLYKIKTNCYDVLFNGIKKGDLLNLHKLVNNTGYQSNRQKFESRLRKALAIDEALQLYDVI